MAPPDEELRLLLAQLQKQARHVHRALERTHALLSSSAAEARQLALTLPELDRLSTQKPDIELYRPVGKTFLLEPRPVLESLLQERHQAAQDDVAKLAAKIKSLESEVETNQRALKDLVRSIDVEVPS